MDEGADPAVIFDASPILFWTIILVACRHVLTQQQHFPCLSKKLPALLGSLMVARHSSSHTIQALLILSMRPPPVQRQTEDMRWIYSGMTLQLALQAGYHRVGYEHEYLAFPYSKSAVEERKHTRLWRAWCFVNAL